MNFIERICSLLNIAISSSMSTYSQSFKRHYMWFILLSLLLLLPCILSVAHFSSGYDKCAFLSYHRHYCDARLLTIRQAAFLIYKYIKRIYIHINEHNERLNNNNKKETSHHIYRLHIFCRHLQINQKTAQSSRKTLCIYSFA